LPIAGVAFPFGRAIPWQGAVSDLRRNALAAFWLIGGTGNQRGYRKQRQKGKQKNSGFHKGEEGEAY
jgi:hypothetical protein